MEFVQVDDPFNPDELDAQQAEYDRLVTECAARPDGHAWTVAGDSGEPPWLSCADCPADGGSVYPDILDLLDGEEYQVGGRTILFGEELPDDAASVFAIPVSVRVELIRHQACDYGGYEYDVEIHITDRETAA